MNTFIAILMLGLVGFLPFILILILMAKAVRKKGRFNGFRYF